VTSIKAGEEKALMFFFLSHLTRTNKKSDLVVWVLANFGSHQKSQKNQKHGPALVTVVSPLSSAEVTYRK